MVKPLSKHQIGIYNSCSALDHISSGRKNKYLKMWKNMMCNYTIELNNDIYSVCLTPDGLLSDCKFCRYNY